MWKEVKQDGCFMTRWIGPLLWNYLRPLSAHVCTQHSNTQRNWLLKWCNQDWLWWRCQVKRHRHNWRLGSRDSKWVYTVNKPSKRRSVFMKKHSCLQPYVRSIGSGHAFFVHTVVLFTLWTHCELCDSGRWLSIGSIGIALPSPFLHYQSWLPLSD